MKDVTSSAAGIVGGVLVGFGMGSRSAVSGAEGKVPQLIRDVSASISDEVGFHGELISRAVALEMGQDPYLSTLSPLVYIVLGTVIIGAGLYFTWKKSG